MSTRVLSEKHFTQSRTIGGIYLVMFILKHENQSKYVTGREPEPRDNVARILLGETLLTTEHQENEASCEAALLDMLARDLHDSVAQDLWFLQLRLSLLAEQMPIDYSEIRDQLEELTYVAQNAQVAMREVLKRLRSEVPEDVNLVCELDQLQRRFSGDLKMSAELRVVPTGFKPVVPGKVAKQVRLLVQEAVWNSYQHSGSSNVRIGVYRTTNGASVTVSDNGRGFVQGNVGEGHCGLKNMRERAKLIHGKLCITSSPGRGTVIALQVPVADATGTIHNS